MIAVRLVKREFGPRWWFSLVRVDNDRVVVGGLRSEAEAHTWAADNGYTIADAPGDRLKAATTEANRSPEGGSTGHARRPGPPTASARSAPSSGTIHETNGTGPWHSLPRPAPAPRFFEAVLTKEEAPCCVALRDDLGRLPIGFCSPACVRRPRRSAS